MLPRLATLALVAAFWWQGERFLAANGPTFDEPVHYAAGYSYWATGRFRLNVEDPPLAKLLWTLPRYLLDPLPFRDEWRKMAHWPVGNALVFDSGYGWRELLTPARRVNLLFGVGVVVLVGAFARRLFDSPASGVVASALAAFDPTLLAHSCVLSTDASLTFCTLLTAWLGWEYIAAPARRTLLALGAAVGLTLGAKFSGVLVVGAVGVGLLATVAAGRVVALPGAAAGRASVGRRFGLAVPVIVRVLVLAVVTLLPLYFVVRFPSWVVGLIHQLNRGDGGDEHFYLLGELSRRGWLWYFAVALAVKLPVGTLALAALGLAGRRPGGTSASDAGPGGGPARLFLPVVALTLFALVSLSRVDLGVRVVLPVVPFVYLLGARFVAPPAPWRRAVAAVAIASAAVSAARAGPYPLSYFNEAVGGPENGVRVLGDSNLDWGQGLPALKDYLDREGVQAVTLSYFGTAPPRAFGIRYEPVAGFGAIERPVADPIPPGPRRLLVVGGTNLQGTYLTPPDTFAWLRDRQPAAVLAGCLWVFDMTADDAARIRRLQGGK